MNWTTLLFLTIVAVACVVALAWVQSIYTPTPPRGCSVCRARQQCVPGKVNECCCRAVDSDGCYHGLGLCEPGLTCVPNDSSTGVCLEVASPEQMVTDLDHHSCDAGNYESCSATEFGDCCCPKETQRATCSPSLSCHRDSYRFLSNTGVCVPPDLHLPPA